MTAGNFNWFLHTMLFLHTEQVLIRQREKEDRRNQNKDDKTDEDDEDEVDNGDSDKTDCTFMIFSDLWHLYFDI
jgi:hypothetical protein